MVFMAIPLWAWPWLWAPPRHRLSTRWEVPRPLQVTAVCVCAWTSNELDSLPPLRCCSRCSWAAPTSEKWPTSCQLWDSSILSSSPACRSYSILPRWSTGALCHRYPGDTCVDWQDCGWVRRYTGWPNTDIDTSDHFLICIFNFSSSVQHLGPCGCGPNIPHSHLHRDSAQCPRQCRLGLLYVASCI